MKINDFLEEMSVALCDTTQPGNLYKATEKWMPIVTDRIETLEKQVADLKMQNVMLETKILEAEVD